MEFSTIAVYKVLLTFAPACLERKKTGRKTGLTFLQVSADEIRKTCRRCMGMRVNACQKKKEY
jgi:hypothetical protein